MCKNEVVNENGDQGVVYLPISMLVRRDLCKNVYEETFDQVWGEGRKSYPFNLVQKMLTTCWEVGISLNWENVVLGYKRGALCKDDMSKEEFLMDPYKNEAIKQTTPSWTPRNFCLSLAWGILPTLYKHFAIIKKPLKHLLKKT